MKYLAVFALSLVLASCATIPQQSYSPPTIVDYSNSITFNNSKDEVWAALVNSASSSFFAIKNFEKDSGLMTLDFGSSRPEDFVDCGTWSGGGFEDFDYIQRNKAVGISMSLSGIMNLLVLAEDKSKTTLRVNARYILNMSGSSYQFGSTYPVSYSESFTFDSKSSDSISVRNAAAGTSPVRTCAPTGLAESQIAESVSSLLQ